MDRPPQATIAALAKAVRNAKRSSVRVPPEFVRNQNDENPTTPLATLIRSGGEVRLKTFLTVLMLATKSPHATKKSSTHIAELLNLNDPTGAGARRVTKAFKDLEQFGLVERSGKPGHTPTTRVLYPDGSGRQEAWNDSTLERPYVSVPAALWTRGWIVGLSGRALALLLVLREFTNGRGPGAYVDGIRKDQYALSDDFWTKATTELVGARLLDVSKGVRPFQGESRRRNLYTLHMDRLRDFDAGTIPDHIEPA